MAKTNYMRTVDDVAQELGVSKQTGYCIICQPNKDLAAAGYMTGGIKGTVGAIRSVGHGGCYAL